jgi:hypothetical protein
MNKWKPYPFVFRRISMGLIMLLAFTQGLYAQSGKVIKASIEVNRSSQAEDFILIPSSPNNLILIYLNDDNHWRARSYDAMLNEKWITDLPFLSQYALYSGYYKQDSTTTIYFSTRGRNASLIQIQIGSSSSGISHSSVLLGSKTDVLTVFPDINGCYVYCRKKKKQGILHIDKRGSLKEVVPLSADVFLNFSPLIGKNGSHHAYTRIRSAKNRKYTMIQCSADAEISKEQSLDFEKGLFITKAYLEENEEGQIVCLGTYSNTHYSAMESGVFSLLLSSAEMTAPGIYPFSKFRNALVVPSQIKRIERARRRGKNPEIAHMLLPHDRITKIQDNYIFLSEVYSPQYTYEQRYNPSTRMFETYQVFEGYLYTHAIVCAFNGQGTLRWDNNIENNQVVSYSLRPISRIFADGDDLVLMYPADDNLAYKVINEYEVVERKEMMSILADKTSGVLEQTLFSTLDHWYEQNFLRYGIQRTREQGKSRKFEFFIRKIAYQ